MKNIAILGSTGSIGTQALEVIAGRPDEFQLVALAAHKNDELLARQIERFNPDLAVLVDKEAARRLQQRNVGKTRILAGEEGLLAAATYDPVHTVVTSMVGFAGLKPTLAAIAAGKTIALANKETLVAAGELVMTEARRRGVTILPVDSEHSAIFQCLQGEHKKNINKLILTASGGPFRGWTRERMSKVTVKECLAHPNWSMGKKITVDSATLINKGLEVIEARWLYDVPYEQIEVVIHPQSIVHSMVEFVDGSIMAQMGRPDMRLPIQYALAYPDRLHNSFPRLDFYNLGSLTFEAPDLAAFPGLKIAYDAGRAGGTVPCVMNAANEVAVNAFLHGQITFLDITSVIQEVLNNHEKIDAPGLSDLCAADRWAREEARNIIATFK
ncbi:1-deoxy-D-xylulose-5-phosphate reductoisomerase [Sporolituus thermophilus]|uniref:1-deoxy-D-xylulose 5-phosphate reductoisomerase n=1 Tax=Sporolituus thermophilus DSM 23256 TaxID=1123285 RepID=A0A1G7KS64_9FIRM|nr:1-deoxy-D-xylulose-5-phosphate reductoisomerase [Sporolituus thermophilus]SDF39780.1 1-deoxy-D-xylulose 5-phosphate reductoisomerase [Sporolituus thermophilus DSM 23256]